MITFDPPLTINPPSFKKSDGSLQIVNPFIIKTLDYLIIDYPKNKTITAKIFPCPKPIILWQNNDYDNIGDYTQNQIEDRLMTVLGSNIKDSLESLFV